MKILIFDTDILSTFGKIRRLDLLRNLLPVVKFLISPSVYNELLRAKDSGYEFVDYMMESGIFEITPLTKEELEFSGKLGDERKSLGSGELESISLCKLRNCILVTNDTAAKRVCDHYGIEFIDLSMILKSLLTAKVLTKNEVRALINEIEDKDKVIIKDINDILNSKNR